MTTDGHYSFEDLATARVVVEEHFDRAMRSVGLDPEDTDDLPLAAEFEYPRALLRALNALEHVICRTPRR